MILSLFQETRTTTHMKDPLFVGGNRRTKIAIDLLREGYIFLRCFFFFPCKQRPLIFIYINKKK